MNYVNTSYPLYVENCLGLTTNRGRGSNVCQMAFLLKPVSVLLGLYIGRIKKICSFGNIS